MILISYYLVLVFTHLQISDLITFLFKGLPRKNYDFLVLVLFITLLIFFYTILISNILKMKKKKNITSFLLISSVFVILSFNYLITINVEVVHFVQYGFFAFLLFPLIRNYAYTIIVSFLCGMMDEAYQYFILTRSRPNYYDFNDVCINIIGAGIGLLLIKSLEPEYHPFSWKSFLRSKLFTLIVVISSLIIFLFISGLMTVYPNETAKFVLAEQDIRGFFTRFPPGIVIHVIKPMEGILISVGIIALYSFLEKD
ncbi:MAG: VanZ family protein [Melioribacteraceae bacterium]|nr:VanZ family protein [Melioribacteraceae bacterium]